MRDLFGKRLICSTIPNMKLHFALPLIVLFVSFILPLSSYAYETTSQNAVRLNDNTILFTITARFSYMNHELRMPIAVERKPETAAAFPNVGYELFTADGKPYTGGTVQAVVLSDSKIIGTEYALPLSKPGYFTLVALVTLPPDVVATEKGKEIHLRTTTQPFTLKKGNILTLSQLSDQQLSGYKTPAIKL